MRHIIKNFETLASSKARRDALCIIESGYEAIDTTLAVERMVSLDGDMLSIKGKEFNLKNFKRTFVIGFGKASCKATQVLEKKLKERLTGGIVIDKNTSVCEIVTVYEGTHPVPSEQNVDMSHKIADLATEIKEDDLAIVIASGGGSALLCYPKSECYDGERLYKAFLDVGGKIEELNTLRKHISEIKGGGLAKMLYPATVVALIFCDVPGEHYEDVASGPTYFDKTTIADAEKIIAKYSIPEKFNFVETPKKGKYFEKVVNIPFVSNLEAVKAMETKARKLGYSAKSLGTEIYNEPTVAIQKMKEALAPNTAVIAGGELSVKLKNGGGVSGRNLYTCGLTLSEIQNDDVFISFASDGIDNLSVSAGAIVDKETINKIRAKKLSPEEHKKNDKYEELFVLVNDTIITGPTGSNVSDLYVMLRP